MTIAYRYFLALLPPARLIPALARERLAAHLAGAPVADERLHMTLVAWPLRPAASAWLVAAIADLLAPLELPACATTLRRQVLGARSACLTPVGAQPELRALQQALHRRMRPLGALDQGFHPHVTLGYAPERSECREIAPIGWLADRLVLVESRHGAGRHRQVAAWPLTERQRRLF